MSKKNAKKVKKLGRAYDASSITVLEGLEPVRKRPGMYIGTTGPDGLHHLITEIFDNSRDEAMGDFADDIEIVLLPGNRVRVVDNGRGIPVDTHKQSKVSALETIMTTLHAGGKFGGDGYEVSGGLHGVGASVVNALSIYCEVVVHRDGGVFAQEYKQGKRKASVKKIGSSKLHGTIVTFEPDAEIFKEGIAFDFNRVVTHMRQQAYLVKGLRISVMDAREVKFPIDPVRGREGSQRASASNGVDTADIFYLRELGLDLPSQSFYFEGGLLSLVKFQNHLLKPIHKNIFYVEKKVEGVESVEVALQYVDDIASRILPFANNIYNGEGGTHITGFKTALTRTLNTYARKGGLVKESEDNFTGDDVLEGLTAVISVKLREIQFEGQTKAKLGSMEAQGAVATVFGEAFTAFLEENPDDARAIVYKVVLALKARKAAKAAKDSVLRKGALEGMTLPGKLADCQSKDASESELFIVEGDSAGGCFHGDTSIALADGRNLSFKELVEEDKNGKQNFCYTTKANGNIAFAEILHPRVTKRNAEVIKITLDNGKELVCTPDHLFMLRNGSYTQAQFLTKKDSLMPLYRKVSKITGKITIDGYEMIWDQAKQWIFTHMLADMYNLERGIYTKDSGVMRHHVDFNKLNNNPTNITRLSKEQHLAIHRENVSKTLHRKDVKEKVAELHKTKEFREKIKAWATQPGVRIMLSERAKKQWTNEFYKKFMLTKFLEFYHSNDEYRLANNKLLNENQKAYWSSLENRKKQSGKVIDSFLKHPERKIWLREEARKEWSNESLLAWRSEETKKQWTPEFREKRKNSYNQTYLNKALKTLHGVYLKHGSVDADAYNAIRKETNDKSLIKWETVCSRFFEGDTNRLFEAVTHYNHRVKKIEKLSERIDVYDIEVPETHNFALASGIFVHNSAKTGRDRKIQAVLPLRGKILNIERARLDKMLASEQIKNMVIAIGTAIGDTFDISKLRYHKIIIATDADVDGAHIRTLILTLLYRHFRQIIEGGFIYIAQPPLYKIKKGREIAYVYTEEEKVKYLGKDAEDINLMENRVEESQNTNTESTEEEDENTPRKNPKISIQRYKGLGEMNPEELWETTMDPARRILKQVKIEDAQDADKVFDMLMGTDVPSRKSFIQSNAKLANLDI